MTTAKIFRTVSALLFIAFCFPALPSFGQVAGCKDPYASNYNPSATVNNGSCTYNAINYTPPVKVDPMNDILDESSGLQMAGDYLWSFNDGGNDAAIYRIDTLTSAILQTVNLDPAIASNIDWEDIAFDGTYFYIGDFGNNVNGARADLKIYKFKFSAIPTDYVNNPIVTIPRDQIEIINFKYSDQPQPLVPTTDPNTTAFDCEAMIVDGGKIHLFSKNWIASNTTHYIINSTSAGTYDATPLETLETGYLVTGADKVAGKNIIALIGYQTPENFGIHYMHLLSDYSGGYYFNGNQPKINLGSPMVMGQAEGITFKDETYGYISNEKFTYGGMTVSQKLRSFTTTNFIPTYVLPFELKSFSVVNSNDGHKISWSFLAPVKNLKIQYSNDSIHFTDLKKYGTSISDAYFTPVTTAHCYRLAWQKDNGSYNYSSIICVRGSDKSLISNISVKANGQLVFTVNESATADYAFKLITTDGKLLAQLKKQSYAPGAYSVSFSKSLPANSFVFLMMYNNTERKSVKLLVGR